MNELIKIVQTPVIEEHLLTLKQRWEQMALDADAMFCNEETIHTVKQFRAEMRKEFREVDSLRLQIRKAVLEPYFKFDEVFKEFVSVPFEMADMNCKKKIADVEREIKLKCEESLREYFDELKTAHHVEWLEYEQAGIKIDMASARQKTPNKLREQLVCFVVRVSRDVDTISTLGNADEILAEYKPCLNLSQAIGTVTERHRRIESERQALDTRSTARAAEIEAERRIEALGPPTIVKPPEKDPDEVLEDIPFKIVRATRRQIWRLKEFMDKEGIQYE